MPTKQRRAIVFAPGWGGLPPKALNPLLGRFTAGWDTISLNYPNHGFDSLGTTAKALSEQLKIIRPSYDHITWIGHSMGGLIPWYLFEAEVQIDAFVSLGTPWNGSALAAFAPWSQSAKQMRPGSEYLDDLRSLANNSDIPKLSVTGAWDFIVPKNGFLENSDIVKIPYCSHTRLIASQRAYYEIWAWLTYKVFKEVGHEDNEGF